MRAIQDEWTDSGLNKGQKYYRRHIEKRRKLDQSKKYDRPEFYLYEAARCRAAKKNIYFDISPEDVSIPEYCPALGLKLFPSDNKATDNSPSLDRIDNSKGYIKGNIQVISNKANRLKGDATLEDIEKLHTWMKTLYG